MTERDGGRRGQPPRSGGSRSGGSGGPRRFGDARRSGGERGYGGNDRPRRYNDGDRPRRFNDRDGDRPRRYGDGDRAQGGPRKYGERDGDRPRRYNDGDRRSGGERGYSRDYRPRRFEDRDGERPSRFNDRDGDRSQRYNDGEGPRRYGQDHRSQGGPRKYGDRDGDRPRRFGDGGRSQGGLRKYGDRDGDGPRRFNDGDRRSGGERGYGRADRPRGHGDRDGDRPRRFGDGGRNQGGPGRFGDRDSDGPRKFNDRDGDRRSGGERGYSRDDRPRRDGDRDDDRPRRFNDRPPRPRDGDRPRRDQAARNLRGADRPRLVAFEAMRAVARGGYANLVLPNLLRDWDLHGRDAAFVTELTYGATRLRGRYDPVIRQVAGRSKIDPAVMDILRLGVHQVSAMRVPDHAAVAASVAVARDAIGPGESTFVNAILRAVTEGPFDTVLDQVAPDDAALEHLVIRHSHPLWVVRALRQAMVAAGRDPEELPQVLASANQNAPVTLVARPGLITREQLAEQVASRTKGESKPGRFAETALIMSRGAPGDLQAIRHGQAAVQDEGSQLVALALAQAQVEDDAGQWLDLCAGPGGKAGLLGAIAARCGAHLTAIEPQEHRAELVRHAVAHVADSVTVIQEDGRMVDGQFDRVLVDAPCTGLGALRRRPEARWRHSPSDLASLGPLQRDLLSAGLDHTRPGGVVVYATCSPHVAETRLVISDVLKARTDAVVEAPPQVLAQVGGTDAEGLTQLWTDQHGTDSMFIAVIRKVAG